MNLTAMIGLLGVNGVFILTIVLTLGGFSSFIDVNSIIIVVGGSLFAVVFCFPFSAIKKMIKDTIKKVIRSQKRDFNKIIDEIIGLAQAKRKGDSAFDQEVGKLSDNFLKDAAGVLFWTKAEVSADEFKDLLVQRSKTFLMDSKETVDVYQVAAKFPPSFGMMGTVLGLIALLQSLGNPDAKSHIGPAMAVALVTTLYGIAINNLILIPISSNLETDRTEERKLYGLIIEGIMLIQQNKPTKYIEEKLKSHLMPEQRATKKA